MGGNSDSSWHVLHFICDEGGSCALTALARGVRFHIIADIDDLNRDTEAGAEYWRLLEDLRGKDTEGQDRKREKDDDTDTDSGVDVNEDGAETTTDEESNDSRSPEEVMRKWMFAPISTNLDALVPQHDLGEEQTLQQWYHCPARFSELRIADDEKEIEAIELEATAELQKQLDDLIPTVTLPKYITTKLDVPLFDANELDVLDASDQPVGTPYHPCRVRHRNTNQVYFLKVVDNSQPQPTKRELDVLNRIKSLKLHESIKVPVLEGLVTFDDTSDTPAGKKRIMGFLQTDIAEPTPLTSMFDPSVSKEKRDLWAKEADRIKDILHKNNIIWGDAKADNFMVDKDDQLWIIDFGGSYTEGWVDPELNETKEGDNMGTTKIVNALEDPVANVQSADDNGTDQDASESHAATRRKRKVVEAESQFDDEDFRSAKRKRSTSDDEG